MLFTLFTSCDNGSNEEEEEEMQELPVDKSGNLLGTGDSANDLLSGMFFTKVQIEIAYVTGFRPSAAAIGELEDFIREHTFKTDIEFVYNVLESPNQDSLELEEIDDLEQENRTIYNHGETIGVYIYFSDAPAVGDDLEEGLVTLGAVYRNTSMVIYESTVQHLAGLSSSISIADVETATLNHEFGHLFGLVNIGTTPINDHEGTTTDDSGNTIGTNHCNVPGCLMLAELQFGSSAKTTSSAKPDENGLKSACSLSGLSVLKILELSASGKGAAVDLDPQCILDLQSNGGR